MRHVAVVGGGASGLAAAYFLKRLAPSAALLVDLYDRVGHSGKESRASAPCMPTAPFRDVHGRHVLRARGLAGLVTLKLIYDLGLSSEIVRIQSCRNKSLSLDSDTDSKLPQRFVLVNDRVYEMPMTLKDLVTRTWPPGSPFESARASVAIEFLTLMRRPSDKDESVDNFLVRHYGRRLADAAGSAFANALFASDSKRLSLKSVLPLLRDAEEETGTLSLGVPIVLARENRATEKATKALCAEDPDFAALWSYLGDGKPYVLRGDLDILLSRLYRRLQEQGVAIHEKESPSLIVAESNHKTTSGKDARFSYSAADSSEEGEALILGSRRTSGNSKERHEEGFVKLIGVGRAGESIVDHVVLAAPLPELGSIVSEMAADNVETGCPGDRSGENGDDERNVRGLRSSWREQHALRGLPVAVVRLVYDPSERNTAVPLKLPPQSDVLVSRSRGAKTDPALLFIGIDAAQNGTVTLNVYFGGHSFERGEDGEGGVSVPPVRELLARARQAAQAVIGIPVGNDPQVQHAVVHMNAVPARGVDYEATLRRTALYGRGLRWAYSHVGPWAQDAGVGGVQECIMTAYRAARSLHDTRSKKSI